MKIPRPFLLVPLCAIIAGCADTAKDASGFSGDQRLEALQNGTVLPGMSHDEVRRIWGAPQQKQMTGGSEEWIYNSGPVGSGYDVHTSVKFTQGKVSEIMNADLMAGRKQEPPADVLPYAGRGSTHSTGSASFQALPGAGPGF